MRITAFDTNTDESISVIPIAIKPSDSWDMLLILDAENQRKITGIYGASVEEWEDAANAKLADFGFKLGALDRRAKPAQWELVDA